MESDIVDQLRARNFGKGNLEARAADEIVRLRRNLKRTMKQAKKLRDAARPSSIKEPDQ